MTDEDNFDIDIYGDGEGMDEDSKEFYKQENQKSSALREQTQTGQSVENEEDDMVNAESTFGDSVSGGSYVEKPKRDVQIAPKSKPQQGVKRKGDSEDYHIDVGATNALMISDLHWWTTEDDIRGWANEANAESELKDVTFSEHKVNGKSKGQAFVEFTSPRASTATKRGIESLTSGPNNSRKFSVVFTNPSTNPFKTLPKDAPARMKDDRSQRSSSASYSTPTHHNNYHANGNFRGARGGNFNNNRGTFNPGYHNNRNFSGPANMGSLNNGPGFHNNMSMMSNFSNFASRGGMIGTNIRGNISMMRGRGTLSNSMMPMGMMGMGMNMSPMVAGMGQQGFGGAGPQFSPGMFNHSNQGMNTGDWSHGTKRQRHD